MTTLEQAYDQTPPADGRWAWYSALGAQVGRSAGAVYYWHRRTGRAPRYVIPTACRWCGESMPAAWAERVASRLCAGCCREAGLQGGR